MEPYQHTAKSDRPVDRGHWTGWFPRPDRGRLRLTGADAINFLQALVTNDLSDLRVGQSRDAAYLTKEGRMVTDMRVFRGDDDVIVSVPAEIAEPLSMRLDFLVFADDVQVADVSRSLHEITLVGASMSQTKDVFFPADRYADVRSELIADGLPEIDADDAEAMRIEAGIPRWGRDMDEQTIPLEAGLLERAISRTKGCYVGQEVIVRILDRGAGRVARRLMKIAFGPDVVHPPAAGAQIVANGAVVGFITSAARSRMHSRVFALGYVQRDHANDGAVVMVDADAAVLHGPAA